MQQKDGVRVQGLKPEALYGMMIADSVVRRITGVEMTVTSVCEGTHMPTSLHYDGRAFDVRTLTFTPATVQNIVGDLKRALGPDFDVVLEGSPQPHIHVEFDPKTPIG